MGCLFTLLTIPSVWAQWPGERDPLKEITFEPELVMQNQQAIGLSDAQRSAIVKQVTDAQAKFTELQWDMQRRMESFVSLLSEAEVDEEKARAALAEVLELESKVKQTHLVLAIRIKNQLTPDQQVKLREIRGEMRKELVW